MKASERYYNRVSEILGEVFREEAAAIEEAAQTIAEANRTGQSVFAFGCNHAGLITLELFYRTGGLVTVNPVRAPGMMLELSPPTMTSEMERMPGYGRITHKYGVSHLAVVGILGTDFGGIKLHLKFISFTSSLFPSVTSLTTSWMRSFIFLSA